VIGRRSALLSAAVLAALLTAVPAGPAHAADPLELSLDGIAWSASLPARLFASPAVIVPGDVLSSALWVRNSTGDPARVDLEVADDLGVAPGTLAGDLSLSIDGDPVSGGSRWDGPVLAPGASVRIPLVVSFSAASPSTSQMSAAMVLESVLLVQTGVGVAPTPTSSAGAASTATGHAPQGSLARTGQDVAGALLVSLTAVGLGMLLVAARRRRRRTEA
jgi:hypothetical protein